MDQRSESSNVDIVTACVAIFRDLEREIQTATSAIACNRLVDLEESLWRQETLCAKLKRAISTIRPAGLDAGLAGPIRSVACRLRAQTQVYEKLVTQSSRSTAILQHLCSLYRN